MSKQEILDKIILLEDKAGMWEIALNEHREADFVIGYYYDDTTEKYNVFINNERGWHSVRLSTNDEIEALEKLLSMVEFEVKTNERNVRKCV